MLCLMRNEVFNVNKDSALQNFWSLFGLPAYEETTVPDNAKMPYITYSVATDSLYGEDVTLSANLWYFSNSWKDISLKAQEISNKIGFGGYTLKTDTGYVWIKRRTPFAQRMSESDEPDVRSIYLSISAEFIDK